MICLRCNHEWVSRVEKPRRCPNCFSTSWDRESRRGVRPKLEMKMEMEQSEVPDRPNLDFARKLLERL